MAKARAGDGELKVVRLTPSRMDDMGKVLHGTWGSACWCMFPRLNAKLERELPGPGDDGARRKRAMSELAARKRAPGLMAYVGREPAGWIAIAPRPELVRIDRSRVTVRVDEVPVWVIPCITVRRQFRGRGVALALIAAAVEHAAKHGAPAVEAYPRASSERVHDDFAFIGTQPLFKKAGFKRVGAPLRTTGAPRVTMRIACTPATSPRPRARSAVA
jgi:GNAT superfamily N-acetyltransferase